jgi:hypothetical protein
MSTTVSIFQPIQPIQPIIATLATTPAEADLRLFLKSLALWNSPAPRVVLMCSEAVKQSIQDSQAKNLYPGEIIYLVTLNEYDRLTRAKMERLPSRKGLSNLFHDFTEEKCALLDFAFQDVADTKANGVLFCDADIFWLAPLPQIPEGKTLALSPHMIRKADEAKFGEYNAGFLWTNDTSIPSAWREACAKSRFFEQAALEDLADATPSKQFYTFPIQVNYGWWRMFQADKPPEKMIQSWGAKPTGITVEGDSLVCIHTHWMAKDSVSLMFNKYVRSVLMGLQNHSEQIKKLVSYLPPLL